ncbi:MAG: NAD(P)-binding domain-containing protein [Candidatus Promineifilaceae bacterium]|nr:NAD(P)-binding domain-containing protein [Candidatus Promineifilaceae bacterium]
MQFSLDTEVIIVGGGPIGIELAIALKRACVAHILIEARQIGAAISRWPAHTHFFSTNEHVALAGVPVHNLNQQPLSGDQYLAYLRMLVEMFDLRLHNYETVIAIDRLAEGFEVRTHRKGSERLYRARYVVLATGGLDRPRRLNIPGEDMAHVSHYFEGPHKYFRTRLLVVGGKNSALEAALRCWRAGAQVAISYRRPSFDFDVVKPHLGMDIRDRLEKGEITFYPATLPTEITADEVVLTAVDETFSSNGHSQRVAADFVLLATGFKADMRLFVQAGVELLGERQQPRVDAETMETNVPGLFVAGTAGGGTQERFEYFISTTHDHVAKVVKAITGRAPERIGTVPARNNAVTYREVKAN